MPSGIVGWWPGEGDGSDTIAGNNAASINSVDDCIFAVVLSPTWWNSPTVRHNQGGQFSFADGHCERWRWRVLGREQDWVIPTVTSGGDTTEDLKRVQDAVVAR